MLQQPAAATWGFPDDVATAVVAIAAASAAFFAAARLVDRLARFLAGWLPATLVV